MLKKLKYNKLNKELVIEAELSGIEIKRKKPGLFDAAEDPI